MFGYVRISSILSVFLSCLVALLISFFPVVIISLCCLLIDARASL